MGAPFALDYGAVFAVAEARGADTELLSDVLPAAENAIVSNLSGDPADINDKWEQ